MSDITRRDLLRDSATVAAGLAAATIFPTSMNASAQNRSRLRFGVIGLNHGHINSMVDTVVRNGGELVSFYAREPELARDFARRYPSARQVGDDRAIIEDNSLKLVVSAAIPDERAALGIRAMRAGKDVLVDKPGMTTLEQLAEVRRVQAETKRIYSILYGERLENHATVRAAELVKSGAIGRVIQTVALGPHRIHPPDRPDWFWDPARHGGILCDIGSHQFDQFLYFAGASEGSITAANVRNVNHPSHPAFQDFGEVMVRGNDCSGYIRVDWFTPAGLPTWGDGRLTVLGTDGYIEVRKYVDLAGREGGSHLFLVDQKGVQYVDCRNVEMPYGRQFVDDVLNRTETAMAQEHCFLAMELALKAQQVARQ